MVKKHIAIFIAAVLGVLLLIFLLPTKITEMAQKVLGDNVIAPVGTVLSSPIQAIGTLFSPHRSVSLGQEENNSPLSVEAIIDATNQERIQNGLQPLKTNSALEQSAKVKTQDMITNQYFEHTSPDGKTVADLANEAGYDYVVIGENLALGDFTNAQDLLNAWMNSPGHRANILNPAYQDIGVYAAQGTYQGQTVWFAVQHFGTEREVCPSISTTLKNGIDALNTSIQNQETVITTLRTQIEDPNHVQGQAYTDMISQFNSLVAKYNADLATSQAEIVTYNKEVVAFNKCLSQYQVPAPTETGK